MSRTKTPRTVSDAVAGVRAMQSRLAQGNPEFARAVDLESKAENFCRNMRADLRQEREKQGIDQAELGKMLDLTQSAVSKIETSAGDLGLKTAFRYARALGLQPVVLLLPSADSLMEQAPEESQKLIEGENVVMTTSSRRAVIDEAQVELMRKLSHSVSSAVAGIAKAIG